MARRSPSASLRKWRIEAQSADYQRRLGRGILRGSLIVWAISEGREMAAGVEKYLQAKKAAKTLPP